MKLYTEEQVREIVLKSRETGLTADYLLINLTPIELPSDEEVEKMVGGGGDNDSAINGALWMKEQILNQNKQKHERTTN